MGTGIADCTGPAAEVAPCTAYARLLNVLRNPKKELHRNYDGLFGDVFRRVFRACSFLKVMGFMVCGGFLRFQGCRKSRSGWAVFGQVLYGYQGAKQGLCRVYRASGFKGFLKFRGLLLRALHGLCWSLYGRYQDGFPPFGGEFRVSQTLFGVLNPTPQTQYFCRGPNSEL